MPGFTRPMVPAQPGMVPDMTDPASHPGRSPLLLVHGGAGTIAAARHPAYRNGMLAALEAGWQRFEGGDALAAALAAVECMEADPDAFNAGVGGSPNRDGVVELDAAVMHHHAREGASAGAVAAVANTPFPARLADRVRRESPHLLLVGAGAERLVEAPVPNAHLLTDHSRAALERWRRRSAPPQGTATVGAVARGPGGDLAAVTSTGGVLGKWPGRVGDAPIPGAGTYADAHAAVSCTGKGEAFLLAATAKALCDALAAGAPVEAAVAARLGEVAAFGGDGGLICIDTAGRAVVGFNAPQMAFGLRSATRHDAWVSDGAGVRRVDD